MNHSEIKDIDPGIFAQGVDYQYGWWVAVRGGICDWTIYAMLESFFKETFPVPKFPTRAEEIYEYVNMNGNKVPKKDAIQMIRADSEMVVWYRQ